MGGKQRLILLAITGTCLTAGCSKDPLLPDNGKEALPLLPETPYSYSDNLPSYFASPPMTNSIHFAVTDDGATLGRVLFYDKKLSKNDKISCGSCHQQSHGFSDPRAFSFGFQGGQTARNSVEMGMDLSDLAGKLGRTSYYPSLFMKAFGSADITTERISVALGEFVQSIQSYRSRYDQGLQNGFADFSSIENSGLYLFNSIGCRNCHQTENLYSETAFNNGLDSVYTDRGVGAVTGDSTQDGLFKVPSLRNIAVTAPYMHDGRFATLDEVIEHYDSGVHQNRNLSAKLTTNDSIGGPPKRLYLLPYQKLQLIAFLETLTDQPLLNDPRFTDPFPQ
jgi:cytochrome c peroxidase